MDSTITIPRFQNSGLLKKENKVFQLEISNQTWKINSLTNVDLDRDFYTIDSSLIDNGNIFCLATEDEILRLEKDNYLKLLNLNNFTDTSPEQIFRYL